VAAEYDEHVVIAVGYGLLPSSTAASQLYHTLTIAAEVDSRRHVILDASIALLTDVSSRWLRERLLGLDLASDPEVERFARVVEKDFLGNSQRAILHAFRDLTQRYREHIQTFPRG